MKGKRLRVKKVGEKGDGVKEIKGDRLKEIKGDRLRERKVA